MEKLNLIKKSIFWLVVIFLLFWPIKSAFLGHLTGTFKAKQIPLEYYDFKNFINKQGDFFRIFWVPKGQRFGFWSNNHPGVDAEEFFTESNCQEPLCSLKVQMPAKWGEKCFPNDRCAVRELAYFLNPKTKEILSKMAVKYVVVPYDLQKEIFIAERQYNPQQRKEVEQFLDTIPWLKKIRVADNTAVYELPEHKDHFFLLDTKVNRLATIKMINTTKYLVSLHVDQVPTKLVFSETYNQLWRAKVDGQTISSKPFENFLNSFEINKKGDLNITVEFSGQKYVYWGGLISLLTLLVTFGGLVFFAFRRNRL